MIQLAKPWKEAHAFRIRGPFGQDSLYVVLMGHPADGAQAKLIFDDKSANPTPMTSSSFPHEFLLYPVAMDQDLKFHLQLQDANKKTITTQSMMMYGGDGLAKQ